MTVKYLAHCTLLPIWIRGYDEASGKYMYTCSRRKAKKYNRPEDAMADIVALGRVWAENMEVEECQGH